MTEEVQTGTNPIANITDIADIETPLQISQIYTYMTEEVQTGRNPIASIADIADIENSIANITDIEHIADINLHD